jgi:hypothetical protein
VSLLDGIIENQKGLLAFRHRYGFSVQATLVPRGDNTSALDIGNEIKAMRFHVPMVTWKAPEILVPALIKDFEESDEKTGGVLVGNYGDMNVWMRISYEGRIQTDKTWRRGLVRTSTDTSIVFGCTSGDALKVEYFVRTIYLGHPGLCIDVPDPEIDYLDEQLLMCDVARMLFFGLHQRAYQGMIKNNPTRLRLRYQKKKVA